MRKKLLMLCLGIFVVTVSAFAQVSPKVITGKVTDEDALPLPGVSVKIKGTNTGTLTGADGHYSIRANVGQVLVFSFLGTVAQERTVGDANTFNVTLRSDTKGLNEVVVTALGITRDKKAIGYGTQTLMGEDVAQTQRDNFLNAMQGRVAGATITPTTGTPGASASIVIRGGVSLDGNNQPLFVVDGLPISNRTFSDYSLVGEGSYNRTNDYGNRAMDINPEEIASITILKGPEAAALYGTEGASGAVIITTKKAKAGSSAVNYSNSFRIENVYRFPDVQNVYAGGAGGIFDEEVRTRTYFGAKYPENRPLYDNIGNFYRTGFTQKHNVSVEGGTDKLSLRTSVAFTDQSGSIPGTAFSSLNARVTGTAQISSKIDMSASMNFITSKTDKTYKGTGSPMLSVLTWPRLDDMRNYLTPAGDRRTLGTSLSGELDNPYWGVNKNPNWDKVSRVLSNISLNYKPASWFIFTGRVGVDFSAHQGLSAYHPQSYAANSSGSTNVGGGINTFTSIERMFNAQAVATLKKDFGKFKPVFRIGGDLMDNLVTENSQFGTRFYDPNFYSMNNVDPSTKQILYGNKLKRKVGFISQAELGYGDFLYVTLTGRMDNSSTLPYKNHSFFYPATSLSFVFSELESIKKLDWLSFGKFRTAWGQSGKDASRSYITKNRLIPQTTTGGGFATDVTAGNPDLTAEFTTTTEAGLEIGFFKNRLSFDFSVFQNLSDKQITAPRLSYGTGAVLAFVNSGKIRNRGFELLVKGTPVKRNGFSWDISANASRVRGYILSLPAGQDVFYLSDTWLYDDVRAQYKVGSSLSAFAGVDYIRNDKGQLLINPSNGMPIKDTKFTHIGDRAPDIMVGLTNSFTYKSFNVSFLLDIRKGGDIYNATENYLYQRGMSKMSLDREVPRIIQGVLRDGLENTDHPTPNNILVIPYITTSYYSTYYNTRDFIEKDVNWIRLKDITLSYNLPKNLLAKTNVIKRANVFVTGTDLLLLTNYKGVDPAVNGLNASSGGLGGSGIDYGSTGLPRGLNLGVKIGF